MRKLFIDLLNEQPNQNFGNPNTKINIHLPIRGEMLEYCIELNKKVQELTNSGVDFSPKSFQIPHITLYMGFVRNEKDYSNMLDSVYEFSKQLEPFEIFPTFPYAKEPKNNYLFIDTEQTQKIIEIKKQLKEKVDKFIEPLNWDVVNETPHITVGYIKNNVQDINALFNETQLGPSFYADAVELSFGGPWGSCIGTIRTFEFGK